MHENAQKKPKTDLSPKQQIEKRDAYYSINSRDMNEVTHQVIVKRSNGEPDNGWLITGDGVDPTSGDSVVRLEKLVLDDEGNFVLDEQGEPKVMNKIQRAEDVKRYDREQRDKHRPAVRQQVIEPAAPAETAGVPQHERPTVDNPHMYDLLSDAVQIRKGEQGELSVVAGFYYDDTGRVQEILQPMSMAGYDPDKVIRLSMEQQESPSKEREVTRNDRIFAVPEAKGRDRFGNDLDGRLKVTDESLADAEQVARYSDPDIKEFLTMVKMDNPGKDIKELLRTDDELRVKLGEFLLQKQDALTYLPGRFHRDGQTKNANYSGYPSGLSSREYAALLALSMLDGTYKKSLSDPIEIKYGEAIRGQHRYVAMMTLGVERSPLSRQQMKTVR